MTEIPLVLGGHSFISQLGNDPATSADEQCAIVESCLNAGIGWFDTTYQPERVALGSVLERLGRRSEAMIFAWNFFRDFAPRDEALGEADYYQTRHIDLILEQLRTSYVDCLVMVPLRDPEKNLQQQELLLQWKKRGYVRSLGLWVEDLQAPEEKKSENIFRFAIRPVNVTNVTTNDPAPKLAAWKAAGCETLATSPFFRGWELDRIAAAVSHRGWQKTATVRSTLADLLLRFTCFQPGVDRTIVAMRKVEWIRRNLESFAKGPLTAKENEQLQRYRRLASGNNHKPGWWVTLRRGFAR